MVAEKVLLTGASGFIAVHILKLLIDDGYTVIGTVRSESKGEFLKKLYPKNFEYTIVKELSEPNAFDAVFQANPDFTYVLHTASPFTFKASSAEKDFLRPAIDGTLSILKAAKTYGVNLKKIVVTSSFAAILQVGPIEDPNFVYTEDTWSNVTYEQASDDNNLPLAYNGSKAFAEKAAWDFMEKEKPKFSLSTILIPYVWGNPINDIGIKNINTSNEVIANIMKLPKNTTELPQYFPYWVDVHDASHAHVIAMTSDELNNKRVLCYCGLADAQTILDTLHKVRPEASANLPFGKPGSFNEKSWAPVDNSRTMKVLKFKPTSLDSTLADIVDWMEAHKEEK
ncbi:hypothetical protein DV451_003768 [Geotrichum candidum]|uniref:NAD-dependent epimerase/dehydratase domain-containing protein n=1 Tax=Geotrichum candidum TaxID=1173061 RepID=A0A9P5KT88_GEOCN|nr:hypothetical protein DV451_003768 [Geotrichum candidum]KAF5105769.1 hypothetical protein DV453_004544 [Geotrichum candidum]